MQGPKPWDMAAGQLIVMEAGSLSLSLSLSHTHTHTHTHTRYAPFTLLHVGGVCLDPATGGPLDWTSGRVMAGNSEALARFLIDLIKY